MTDLAAVLRELGRAIQDRVVQAIKTGQIRRVPRPDRIWAATDIIPGGGCIWTSSEEAREEWDGGVLQGLVDAFRSEADSGFQKAAKITAQLAGLDEPAASDHILRFLTLAGLRKATGGYAKELESLVARFVAEVSGGPLSWRVVAWLSGVTVESPITLVDGQVLRPPKSDDLAFCANAESPLAGIAPGLLIPPYAVIEVKRRSRERPSSHDARRTVNALCLFGLGSVPSSLGL